MVEEQRTREDGSKYKVWVVQEHWKPKSAPFLCKGCTESVTEHVALGLCVACAMVAATGLRPYFRKPAEFRQRRCPGCMELGAFDGPDGMCPGCAQQLARGEAPRLYTLSYARTRAELYARAGATHALPPRRK